MAAESMYIQVRAIDNASSTLRRIGATTTATTKTTGKFSAFLGRTLARGAKLGGLALIGVGVAAVKTSMDFTKTMNTMKAVAGVPAPALEHLRALAIDLGAKTVFSANEAGEAMLELAKSGISPADIQAGALANTLDLATAGDLELAEAAKIAANAMNVFGLSGKDSKVAVDALAGAANASSSDVDDLAMALSQGGLAAANAGLSIEETTAILGAFADAGLKGSDAGTSLKTFMLGLIPTSVKAQDMMKKLGLSFEDANGDILSMSEIADELQGGLQGLTQAEQQTALKTMFGTDAFRAATIVAKEGSKGLAKYTEETSKSGTAAKVAAAKMEGLPGAWEKLKGAAETALLVIGDAIAPFVEDAANGLAKVAGWISDLVTGITEGKGPLADLGGTIREAFNIAADAVKATWNILSTVFSFIVDNASVVLPLLAMAGAFLAINKAVTMVKGAILAVNVAMKLVAATNPFILIAAVIIGLVVLIIMNWDKIKAFFIGLWASIKNIFFGVWDAIVDFVAGIPAMLMSLLSQWPKLLLIMFLGIPGLIILALIKIGPMLWNLFTAAMGFIGRAILAGLGLLLKIVITIPVLLVLGLAKLGVLLWKVAVGAVKLLVKGITQGIPALLKFIATIPGKAWNALKALAKFLWNAGKEGLKRLVDAIKTGAIAVYDWARALPGKIIDFIKELPGKMLQAGKDMIQGFWDGIKGLWDSVTNWIADQLNGLPGIVKKALGISSPSKVMRDIGKEIPRGLALGIRDEFDTARDAMDELAGMTGDRAHGMRVRGAHARMGRHSRRRRETMGVSIDRRRWVAQEDYEYKYRGY